MLSKITGFIQANVFFASRQKIMLKKRKMTSKKQKVAKKKFLQQDPHASYTNELRILQIQKQLDRKVSKNHHLNELMDELFYPDVRYANQKILQQNVLKLSANPKEGVQSQNQPRSQDGQDGQIEQREYDELVQQIYLCQIPSQLFEVYLKNSQFFTHKHLGIFLERLAFYFRNKDAIQERVTQSWKQSLDKLKLTDVQKKKRKRCPYIFIEREELIRDQNWNKIIKDINRKIAVSTSNISSQLKEQKHESEQEIEIDESFYSLQNNCDIVLQIQKVANYVPEQIFSSIVKKTFAIIDLNKQIQEESDQKIPIFEHSQKVKLLRVLSLKDNTKSTLTKSLHIQAPQNSQKQEQKILSIGQQICQDILKSSQCSAQDLGAVIQSQKGGYKFLNSNLLDLTKPKMFQFLSKTNLQRSIDYITTFWSIGETKDSSFIEVLIFDMYRKLPYSQSKSHLMNFLGLINDCRITFKESGMSVDVASIFPRIAQSIAKYLNRNELTHDQIKNYLNSVYHNYPFYKVESRLNILEMITTSIVKVGQGFKLEEISQLLFKSTILGNRSKIFAKFVFQRFQKEYKNLMKQYKSSKTQLIVDKNALNQNVQPHSSAQMPSMSQIILEETLIMTLWAYVVNLSVQNTPVPLNGIIEIYPLYIHSEDPMICDLVDDLNIHLEGYNFFPKIKNIKSKPKDNKKASTQNIPLSIQTNTSESFKHEYKQSIAIDILEKLEGGNEPINDAVFEDLLFFLMKYSLQDGQKWGQKGLPERWNDSVRNVFQHRKKDHEELYARFTEHSKTTDKQDQNMLNSRIEKIIQKKQKQSTPSSNLNSDSKQSKKGYKLYEFL